MDKRKKIIGIVGTVASGKDAAAEYLAKKENMPLFQISRYLKDLAASLGLPETRGNLNFLGKKIAAEKGHAYLAEVLLPKIADRGIITGMRQPPQIHYLRNNADFFLLAVDAAPEVRFRRARKRGRPGEGKTLEEFVANEEVENASDVQRLTDCMNLADRTIMNNGSLENFYGAIDEAMESSGFLAGLDNVRASKNLI